LREAPISDVYKFCCIRLEAVNLYGPGPPTDIHGKVLRIDQTVLGGVYELDYLRMIFMGEDRVKEYAEMYLGPGAPFINRDEKNEKLANIGLINFQKTELSNEQKSYLLLTTVDATYLKNKKNATNNKLIELIEMIRADAVATQFPFTPEETESKVKTLKKELLVELLIRMRKHIWAKGIEPPQRPSRSEEPQNPAITVEALSNILAHPFFFDINDYADVDSEFKIKYSTKSEVAVDTQVTRAHNSKFDMAARAGPTELSSIDAELDEYDELSLRKIQGWRYPENI
jgi:hypothetical protein